MPEQRISVGDHDLPVTQAGAGRPVVWGHGLTSSRAKEDAYPMVRFPTLADAARLVRYDARGHGTAGGPPDESAYHWTSLATDQLGLVDALGIDTYVAAGVSMGTATALHVAVRHPERIDAMVLTAPPTAWETRAEQAGTYRASADLIAQEGLVAWAEQTPVNPIFADRPFESRIPDIPEDLAPTVLRGAAQSDLPDPDQLRELTMPVFIQAWGHDPSHPESTALRLHELLPNSTVHIARELHEFKGWTSRIRDFVAAL